MKRSTSGSTLLAVIFIMVIVASLAGVVLTITTHAGRLGKRTNERTQAIAYGDAVLESLFDQWRQAMINATASADRQQGLTTSSLTSALTPPSTSTLAPPINISLATWSVKAATPLLVAMPNTTDRPTPENGTRSSLRVRLHYLATAVINFPGPTANTTVTMQRDFVRAGRNIFDNFYFGTEKITEMHPGAPMYIGGTCYVGGDLYTAHNFLHFLKDVTYTGTQTLNYRVEDSRYNDPTQAPDIQTGGLGDNWDLNNPPHVGAEQKLLDVKMTDLDPNFIDDPIANDRNTPGSSVNDNGLHEIIEEYSGSGTDPLQLDNPTNPTAGDPTNSERLSKQADYRIYVDVNNNVTIYKGASTTKLTSGNDFTAITNALTTNTALYDVRDADNVRLVTLDVGAIATAYSAGKILDSVNNSDGLTFYISDTSGPSRDSSGTLTTHSVTTKLNGSSVTSSASRAVKLVNGATLPYNSTNKTGFSVVSPNTVYIQGDYNTGTTGSAKPPSNTATSYTPPTDTPNPVVSGYTRAPAAVAGDAVNILSNSWSDANSTSSGPNGNGPMATSTTVNCAIVAGNVPTTGGTSGSYSGGVENFARFLEDWSTSYFTIYGSLALLYNSEWATDPWSAARYSPPNRRWYYDTLLQDTNPPGFAVARTYERGRRMIR